MGGIARRAQYIERMLELKKPVLQVDAGDLFFGEHSQGQPITAFNKDSALVLARGSAKLKVDAVNVGAQDLYLGANFLKELKKNSQDNGGLNLISSNLVDKSTGQPVFETDRVKELSGIKFGIFGVCRESPAIPGELAVRDPKNAAEQMVKKLKEEKKADLVIGLFNLGQNHTREIIKQVPGIDIAVVSGDPSYIWDPELVGKTVMLQSGIGGKYLGQMEVNFYPGRNLKPMDQAQFEKLKGQLDSLISQLAQMEKGTQNQPEALAKYLELKKQRDHIKLQLEKVLLDFDYEHRLMPLDELMPVDVEVKGWIIRAFKAEQGLK